LATILSAAMMLRLSLKLEEEAAAIEEAVTKTLESGFRCSDIAFDRTDPEITIIGTKEMSQKIADFISKK
jgi:3-isopropylmalate dehydrogenase